MSSISRHPPEHNPDGDRPDTGDGAPRQSAPSADVWHERAEELARWTWEHLVNRHDVWGRYGDNGPFTAPAVSRRGQLYLDLPTIIRHYRAEGRDDVLGLHTTSPNNTCRWIAADIDRHGDDGNDPKATLAAAVAWHDRAQSFGFRPILSGSNGAGGYHLRIVFRDPIPAALAFSLARWLCRDHAQHGLLAVETFPKQSHVGKCGNWLRLPGRHHKRDYWSQVYDGSRWLEGAEAVAHLLTYTGDDPALIPAVAHPDPPRPKPRRTSAPPTIPLSGDALAARIAAYISKLPTLGEGQGRDDIGYRLAAFLVRDLNLGNEQARPWLEQWDSGNNPPKGAKEIGKWLANARAYGQRAYGCGLTPAPRRRRLSSAIQFSIHV